VYSGVVALVNKRIEKDAEAGDPVAQILLGKVDRKVIKQTVMTSVYGVTFIGIELFHPFYSLSPPPLTVPNSTTGISHLTHRRRSKETNRKSAQGQEGNC